ncbi:MAG TPA: S-methyl-5-thioribose-1-phosphate isomerase [Pirellulaceae bacterium]|nr:S-methyl-5-thioribose-1-phosphate isomerase [Pirellulaceae bacterium]HMO93397.1 S-methyl-5-thioribose-1-phosphate isomerase [Pirellulaceae bacterium]HMP70479.1 S-methyl-5-thioribose-1-phosphate isomerase [Pirellulaceae bacterium]
MMTAKPVETMTWVGDIDGHLVMIDQTKLPNELVFLECRDVESVWHAIRRLSVRGAPAIGIAAAYGVVLGMQELGEVDAATFSNRLNEVVKYLSESRPTAVNLFWALRRMQRCLEGAFDSTKQMRQELMREALEIHADDRRVCHAIGEIGATLLEDGAGVLTHCNAGGLATAEYGTALSVFFSAQDAGKKISVFVDETRPLLQGARLTSWELMQRGIDATLICDSMAAQVMREGRVDAVITGADRIAANGDSANKIGTYSLAVLARHHGIPFYIAAPSSSFDLSLESGDEIPIEQRAPEEITEGFGCRTAPAGIKVYNPAFDVTPADYISGIITERGIIRPVTRSKIFDVLGMT